MSGSSNIEWTEATWNPVTGCSKVSLGCAHCYAEVLTKRYAGAKGWPAEFKPWTPANAGENVVLHPEQLEDPFTWRKPRRVFVNSMSDLFHEQVPDEYIDRVFAVMALTPQHTYQVLTKRPKRMQDYMTKVRVAHFSDGKEVHPRNPYHSADFVLWAETGITENASWPVRKAMDDFPNAHEWDWPLPNVWLGVTVENQRWADERIPILLDTPAAVRFVSAEPLLGPIDLGIDRWVRLTATVRSDPLARMRTTLHPGIYCANSNDHGALSINTLGIKPNEFERLPKLDWVIAGGESGPKHREFNPLWAWQLMDQCKSAGVAFFMKQMGGARPGTKLEDLHPDLRVREFPS